VQTVSANDLIGSNQSVVTPIKPIEVEGGILANYTGESLLLTDTVSLTPKLIAAITFPPVACAAILLFFAFRKHATLPTSIRKGATKHATRTLKNATSIAQDQQAIHISKALRTLQTDRVFDEQLSEQIDALLKRCDASQFGCFPDNQLAKDAASLVEQIQ
jgi:hypothetical protein